MQTSASHVQSMNHQKEVIATSWIPVVSQRVHGEAVVVEDDASDGEEGVPGELVENGPTRINNLLA